MSARNSADAHIQQIVSSAYAIAFLGTPHSGADLAKLAAMLCQLVPQPVGLNNNIVETLKPDSEVLADIQTGFPTMLRALRESGKQCIKIVCFYEELRISAGKMVGSNILFIYAL